MHGSPSSQTARSHAKPLEHVSVKEKKQHIWTLHTEYTYMNSCNHQVSTVARSVWCHPASTYDVASHMQVLSHLVEGDTEKEVRGAHK